jgi:16S rRNA (guanine(966)-N(2))-methyltransferase RsmD
MRIISGSAGGRRLQPPKGLPVRPTTDLSKEAICNWIQSRFDWDELIAVDAFSGTGNMGLEFASRGVTVTCVEKHPAGVQWIKKAALDLQLSVQVLQKDAFIFLSQLPENINLVFADPPYDHPRMREIPDLLGRPGVVLILEHRSGLSFEGHPNLMEERAYGQSVFSIFETK